MGGEEKRRDKWRERAAITTSVDRRGKKEERAVGRGNFLEHKTGKEQKRGREQKTILLKGISALSSFPPGSIRRFPFSLWKAASDPLAI